MRYLLIYVTMLAMTACGHKPTPEDTHSHLHYKIASSNLSGLTRYLQYPIIRICYSDSTHSTQHRDDVAYAIFEWIKPLRELTTARLAEKVEFVSANSAGCHATVTIGNYNPARTYMSSRPRVYINYSGWYGSKTVTLHEFGHAFGLLDTYVGSGGSCQSGQPDSVMCRASYETLQEDDISGIKKVFERTQPATGVEEDSQDEEGIWVY